MKPIFLSPLTRVHNILSQVRKCDNLLDYKRQKGLQHGINIDHRLGQDTSKVPPKIRTIEALSNQNEAKSFIYSTSAANICNILAIFLQFKHYSNVDS